MITVYCPVWVGRKTKDRNRLELSIDETCVSPKDLFHHWDESDFEKTPSWMLNGVTLRKEEYNASFASIGYEDGDRCFLAPYGFIRETG